MLPSPAALGPPTRIVSTLPFVENGPLGQSPPSRELLFPVLMVFFMAKQNANFLSNFFCRCYIEGIWGGVILRYGRGLWPAL